MMIIVHLEDQTRMIVGKVHQGNENHLNLLLVDDPINLNLIDPLPGSINNEMNRLPLLEEIEMTARHRHHLKGGNMVEVAHLPEEIPRERTQRMIGALFTNQDYNQQKILVKEKKKCIGKESRKWKKLLKPQAICKIKPFTETNQARN